MLAFVNSAVKNKVVHRSLPNWVAAVVSFYLFILYFVITNLFSIFTCLFIFFIINIFHEEHHGYYTLPITVCPPDYSLPSQSNSVLRCCE